MLCSPASTGHNSSDNSGLVCFTRCSSWSLLQSSESAEAQNKVSVTLCTVISLKVFSCPLPSPPPSQSLVTFVSFAPSILPLLPLIIYGHQIIKGSVHPNYKSTYPSTEPPVLQVLSASTQKLLRWMNFCRWCSLHKKKKSIHLFFW